VTGGAGVHFVIRGCYNVWVAGARGAVRRAMIMNKRLLAIPGHAEKTAQTGRLL